MGRNLTNLTISSSFQYLLQVSESNSVNNGVGGLITDLAVTASHATNAVSASFASTASTANTANTASYYADAVVTSSAAGSTITFTKADGSTYENNITTATANTASLALRNVLTSSAAGDTITFTKGDGTTYTNVITRVSQSIQSEDLFITVKNTSGAPIAKGLAVHATGVTGENVNIKLANSAVPADMPAIGLTETAISNNGNGRVIINGRLTGVNTLGLTAGSPVYVNGAGTLTATKPTGSDGIQNIGTAAKINATSGEIIMQGSGRINDLPNIAQDHVWKGDANGAPQAVNQSTLSVGSAATATSASHAVQADSASVVTDPNVAYTNVNNSFTGTQTFNNIAVNGTGSFAYLESVTGSAKIIGDNYLILNNDTPTQRYGGIKILDSGSSQATASLNFDGQTNDWFYEYSSSGDPDNFGVVMFGPEYNTIGSPTYNTANTLVKANGGHHLLDSNISDDGSTVSIGTDVSITGGLVSTGSTVNLVSTIPGNFQIQRAIQYPSVDSVNEGWTYGENFVGMLDYSGISSRYDKALMMGKANNASFNYFGFIYNAGYDTGIIMQTPSGSLASIRTEMESGTGNADVYIYGDSVDIGTIANRTSDITIGKNLGTGNATLDLGAQTSLTLDSPSVQITGSLEVSGSKSLVGDLSVTGQATIGNGLIVTGSTEISGSVTSNGAGAVNLLSTIPGNFQINKAIEYPSVDSVLRGHTYGSNFIGMLDYSGVSARYDKALIMAKGNSDAFTYSGLIYNSGYDLGFYLDSPSGSIAQFDMLVNNNATGDIRSTYYAQQMDIGSFGSNRVTQINIGNPGTFGNEDVNISAKDDVRIIAPIVDITGSLAYSGNSKGQISVVTVTSQTASLDASTSDYFKFDLVSGSDTHVVVTNASPAQTFVLKTIQPGSGTGTISFSGVKFSLGTQPTATANSSAEDIYTFVSFDSNDISCTQVPDLQ